MGIRLILIFTLWCAVGCRSAAAQDVRAHRVGLDVGVIREAALDELASPLIYRDVFAAAGVSYAFLGTQRRYGASFLFGRPRMTSVISSKDRHVQDGRQFQLDGRYTVRIAQFSAGAGAVFAGAATDSRFKVRHHFYGGLYSEWINEGYSALGLAYVSYRDGPRYTDLTDPKPMKVVPTGEQRFTGQIAVLTNRHCFSACEGFVLAGGDIVGRLGACCGHDPRDGARAVQGQARIPRHRIQRAARPNEEIMRTRNGRLRPSGDGIKLVDSAWKRA